MSENIKILIRENGSALITGTCEITHIDGTVEIKERAMSLCRCGASKNKPFCDGSHKEVGFKG